MSYIRDRHMRSVMNSRKSSVDLAIEAADQATRETGVEHIVNSSGYVVGLKLQLGRREGNPMLPQAPYVDDVIEHGHHQQSQSADLLRELDQKNAERIEAYKQGCA